MNRRKMNKRKKSDKKETGTGKTVMRKLMLSCIAGIVGVILAQTMPQQIQSFVQKRQEQTAITGWWGTLYPKFCFSEFPEKKKAQKDDIKISFWLAQALDW